MRLNLSSFDLADILVATSATIIAALALYFVLARVGRWIRARGGGTRKNAMIVTPRFSPVGADFEGTDEHWMDLAAEVCGQYNRHLGVIALHILHVEDRDCAGTPAKVAEFNEKLSRAISAILRPSDLVSMRERGEILIGVPFVQNRDQVAKIAERLKPMPSAIADELGLVAKCHLGVSIHPADGNSGGELIQSALFDATRAAARGPQSRTLRGAGPRVLSRGAGA